MATRLYLVRHGQTEWSRSGRHTGRTDLPLDEHGEKQAIGLKNALAGIAFTKVVSSPLIRARCTAELAGFPDVETSPLLLEVDYGSDEGRTRDEIRADRPGWDFFAHGGLGGESIEAATARAKEMLASLDDVAGNVLLFSHGHLLRLLTTAYLDARATFGRQLVLGPATISILGHEHEFPTIESWNTQPTLP
ncbi:MAG TPA: histidine phosphatase family protein [Polyangiaceae bacterium]|nr:histidine phosphatase family protein [Polyangiaceae bacterium]